MPRGCDGASLLEVPVDPGQRGPWPVGVRTVTLAGLNADVWYPAALGSDQGATAVRYDIRESLPPSEAVKISDAVNPWLACDCYEALPVADGAGPFPAIVFVHGTASFRAQSLRFMTHWASRGFIVLAADHPGLYMRDLLGSVCGGMAQPEDLASDVATLVGAIRGDVPGLEPWRSVLDPGRIGMAGHSAGGRAIAISGDDAQVLVSLASRGVQAGAALRSTLVIGGLADAVVPYEQSVAGYDDSPGPKRLVGIEGAGHLAFSEMCSVRNEAGQDLLEVATASGVCGAAAADALFQCSPELTPDEESWAITEYVTAAVFEETLHCVPADEALQELEDRFPLVAEYRAAE